MKDKCDFTKYLLEDLSNSSDIDQDHYELIGDDDQGSEVCYETTIQEIAYRALNRINELEAEYVKAEKIIGYCIDQIHDVGKLERIMAMSK